MAGVLHSDPSYYYRRRLPSYPAATLAALNTSNGMARYSRQTIAIGRSPVWLTYIAGPRNVKGWVRPKASLFDGRTRSMTWVSRWVWWM